jgi:hypothetical protein
VGPFQQLKKDHLLEPFQNPLAFWNRLLLMEKIAIYLGQALRAHAVFSQAKKWFLI